MTVEDEEKIKDYIIQAIQVGKSETSGIVGHILDKMDEAIESSVKRHVNGNIRDVKLQLQNQDTVLAQIQTEQARVRIELARLQTDTLPIVDGQKVLTLLGKFVLWLGAILITILTVFKLIK